MKQRKQIKKKVWNRIKLILAMSAIVFTLVSVVSVLFFTTYIVIREVPFLDIEKLPRHSQMYILGAISLGIGLIFSAIFRKFILIPLHHSYIALSKVADGNYTVKVPQKGIKSVKKIAKNINVMASELEGVEKMRNDFINNFSHEFKTPIVSISGFAKILKDKTLTDEEREEYLEIIISESERLSQLSTNVLNLTRLDGKEILSNTSEFNVSEQIRLVVALLEHKWSPKNISIEFECEEYLIVANEDLLRELWINLIDNAIKFTPKNAFISIKIKQKDDKYIFLITDSGKGMSEETIKHAFDRFYQADVSHKAQGYGIGLAISKKICLLHQGSIKIKSTGEKGTTIEVILPVEA